MTVHTIDSGYHFHGKPLVTEEVEIGGMPVFGMNALRDGHDDIDHEPATIEQLTRNCNLGQAALLNARARELEAELAKVGLPDFDD